MCSYTYRNALPVSWGNKISQSTANKMKESPGKYHFKLRAIRSRKRRVTPAKALIESA